MLVVPEKVVVVEVVVGLSCDWEVDLLSLFSFFFSFYRRTFFNVGRKLCW